MLSPDFDFDAVVPLANDEEDGLTAIRAQIEAEVPPL
jgi:hypothetical protein